MSAPLYNIAILRLAAAIPHQHRLAAAEGSAERRSPVCGSRVAVDVVLDGDCRISELGVDVHACALGQASTALMATHAAGRSVAELASARDALTAFLSGESNDASFWPGMDVFEPARAYSARHPSIRLAFEAVVEAAERAEAR